MLFRILVLVVYSLYFLWHQAPKQTGIFIFLLIGITALFLIIPDLIYQTSRSVTSRYMIPSYLGIQIAVAYLLANKITSINVRQQKLWQLVLIALISGSVLSCAMLSQADAWWNKGSSYYYPQVARIINQARRPLAITNTKTGRILTLSHLLEPNVMFKAQPYYRTCRPKPSLHARKNLLDIPKGFSDVFLFSPSEKLRAGLEKEYKIKPAYIKGELWRLEH